MHNYPEIDFERVDALIALALKEDLDDTGDVTTLSVVPAEAKCRAVLLCKEPGMILCGLPVAERVFKTVEPLLRFRALKHEGDKCEKGVRVKTVIKDGKKIRTCAKCGREF